MNSKQPVPISSDKLPLDRRSFLKLSGLAATSMAFSDLFAVAGPFEAADFEKLVPSDKKLSPLWIASLTRRGEPEVFRGRELNFLGLPVGGIACGQLYLGGDGRLWYWDIFKSTTSSDYDGKIWAGPKYEHPATFRSPVEQGFALRVKEGGKTTERTLDRRGFSEVSFRGEYPIGRVTYRDAALPVEVSLEAFSPFIPLNVEDSSLPASILEFSVRNTGATPVEVTLAGWLENAVCLGADAGLPWQRRTVVQRRPGSVSLLSRAEARVEAPGKPPRPDVVYADFEPDNYGAWKVEGTAFGARPFRKQELPSRQPLTGFEGEACANSHNSHQGEDSAKADTHTGKLLSPDFKIEHRYIHFRIGGGNHPGQTGLQLVVDEKVERQATGENGNAMRQAWFDVSALAGRTAHLEIVDAATGGWGHTTLDHIVFSDTPPVTDPKMVPGFGSMALTLLGTEGKTAVSPDVGEALEPAPLFAKLAQPSSQESIKPLSEKLVGALARTLSLAPGTEAKVSFVLSWWFPYYGKVTGEMTAITDISKLRRRYALRFDGAEAVARYVTENFTRLAGDTRLWNRTWYDSTLPYWFLDRTMVTVDCLATQTLHAFDNGRWWGWEGVDCCPGTCQHVWQYAQAVARLFPAIERDWRERVDFGLAWHEGGNMDVRGESAREVAHDGFCGTLVRVYREHQMSPDDSFLRRVWPRVRKSAEFILREDKDADGILEGKQVNTLDAAWYGPMGWISSLYLAALAAAEAMALEMGDADFAARCRGVLDAGRGNIVKQLFNGEYFIHRPPDFKNINTNDGCHIDQVMGQSLAFQVGLPRVIAEKEAKSALSSLWTYSFTPDIGPYREGLKPILPQGRWYAMPGEGGLLMCTWPKGGADKAAGGGNPTFVGYFIECMTGFEYQVAAHMVWEGLVTEGLAITRTIHDRYAAAKRNPYNEVECSDHYSRAMMSYGVFLAACGFEHHGPKGHLGFAPRLTPDDFRCAFTAAEGWGTFSQNRDSKAQANRIEMKLGRLRLKTLAFQLPQGVTLKAATLSAGSKELPAKAAQIGQRVELTLAAEVTLQTKESVNAILQFA